MFSSNRCCFAPLNWLLIDEEEDEDEEADGSAVLDALAAAAAEALFSCSREWAVDSNAMSTEGGRGREEGEGRVDVPDRNPNAMLSVIPGMLPFTPLNDSSSSARRFLLLWLAPEAEPLCVCSDSAGGSRERDSSGFCSLCRRKWALRFPLVVNRLKQTGHW